MCRALDPAQWPNNLSSERDWAFKSEPEKHLNERSLLLSMGKVLGGGSSINVGVWARGHKADWDYYAAETNDPAWNYAAVLEIYKRAENLQGTVDATRRGVGGPVFLEQNRTPHPLTVAQLEAARAIGIPVFDTPNGVMMEGVGGASRFELLVREGNRQSIFRSYTYPLMDQPNLTVLTETLVSRLVREGSKVTGVELRRDGHSFRIEAAKEVVLCLGAIQTPKLLMLSGIGDRTHLSQFGIPVVQHLPGVGQNLRIMSTSAVLGSTSGRSRCRAAAQKLLSTGRVNPPWTRLTCCYARHSFLFRAHKLQSSAFPSTGGRCFPGSRSRIAAAVSR